MKLVLQKQDITSHGKMQMNGHRKKQTQMGVQKIPNES